MSGDMVAILQPWGNQKNQWPMYVWRIERLLASWWHNCAAVLTLGYLPPVFLLHDIVKHLRLRPLSVRFFVTSSQIYPKLYSRFPKKGQLFFSLESWSSKTVNKMVVYGQLATWGNKITIRQSWKEQTFFLQSSLPSDDSSLAGRRCLLFWFHAFKDHPLLHCHLHLARSLFKVVPLKGLAG